jgi:hypothetical protein
MQLKPAILDVETSDNESQFSSFAGNEKAG